MDKHAVLKKIQAKIAEEAENLTRGALHAHRYATHEESKAEGKYDTRGLEASYLAEGQARVAAESTLAASLYHSLVLKEFAADEAIALTALIELDCDGNTQYYFLGPKNGGTVIEYEDCNITLITPTSPLGQLLIGRKEGDYFEVKTERAIREYEIITVW